MASDAERIREAAARYGPSVDAIAHRYVNPVTGKRLSGEALLLKLTEGESRALTGEGRNKVSSAGARGWAQFTAGSRAQAIKSFGIDPWASPEKAVHAAALHLRGKINGSTGLEGYNPDDPTYPAYILGQKVGGTRGRVGSRSTSRGGVGTGTANVPRSALDATPVPVADLPVAPLPQLPDQGIAPPAFTAQAVMPADAQQVPSSGPPQAPPRAPETAVDGQAVDLSPVDSGPPSVPAQGGGDAVPRSPGRVVIAPGAQIRPDGRRVPIAPGLHTLLDDVSAASGKTIHVGTVSRHNQFVKGRPGVESDHWTGHGADLPVAIDSRAGDLLAAHAIQVAAGIPFAQALRVARRGGIHNIETKAGRVQIIWRAPDHHDHVHVGLRPGG